MRADELISRIDVRIPAPGGARVWRKVGTRQAQSISKVCAGQCGGVFGRKAHT